MAVLINSLASTTMNRKNGWIQYVAVLLPLLWIARYVQWFVFGNQIVESIAEPNAILRVKPHAH
eukprot:m.887347 g.887347  ORF g.887347 m.887347 type:complete len:64 (+) comp23636_c0_seq6:1286-1477(+)